MLTLHREYYRVLSDNMSAPHVFELAIAKDFNYN